MPDAPISPPNTTARPSSGGASGGLGGWVTQHKGIAIGGLFVVLVGGYLLIRSRNNNNTQNSQNATGTPATVYPTSSGITGDTNAGDYYAGLLNQFNSNDTALSSQLTGLETNLTSAINGITATTNPSTGSTNGGSASGNAGFGEIDLPGIGESVILGQVDQPGKYAGYDVGGGAPVYFGNANAVSQGTSQFTPGNYVYTPIEYENLVSTTATEKG